MKKSLLILPLLFFSLSKLSAQYCVPTTTTGGTFLSKVDFTDASISGGTLYNTGSGGYTNTTGGSGTISRNCDVTIPVTISNPTGVDRDVSLRVFIDYNGDTDFDDAGETALGYTNTVSASGNISTNLNFRVSPVAVATLRIRFALRQGGVDATACDAFIGEVEDYELAVPANSAPVLNAAANPYINSLLVSQVDNEGVSVGDFINSSTTAALITDADACVVNGIAIVGASGAHGTWEYLLPSGVWTDMGVVSASNALLLAQDDNGAGTRIRFNPTATGTATLEIRAWDQSEGISGAFVNISSTGGTTAFSATSATISHITYSTASAVGNVSIFMPLNSSYTSNFNLRRTLVSRATSIAKQAEDITFDNNNGGGNDIDVDFINSKVVWIGGAGSNELMRSNTDGTGLESLNNSSFSSPSGVAVGGGKIFVADNGNALFSCNPDGSGLATISGGAGQATDIANTGDIEFAGGKIYYVNQPVSPGDYFIMQANADGTGTVSLYNTPNVIQGLAISGTNMYWTEWDEINTSEVLSRSISGGTANTLLSQSGKQFRDLLVDANNNRIYFISLNAVTLNFTNVLTIPLAGGTPTSRLTLSDIVFSMAMSVDLSVLPVRYLQVEANRNNQHVLVQWKTADEVDVLRYAVQRSADGRFYTNIGEVVASGSRSYSFTDVQPISGTAYYRIVNIDKDGRMQYSNVVVLSSSFATTVKWYPTLVQQQHIVLQTSQLAAGKYEWQLINAGGQIVSRQSLQLGSNSVQQIALPLGMAAGTYTLVLSGNGQRWIQTIVKQ